MLFIHTKRLLPKEAYDRDALTLSFPNIKSRLILIQSGLNRLKNISAKFALVSLVLFLSLGSYLTLPNTISAQVYASEQSIQFVLPHTGLVSTFYSAYHPGIDLATDLGTSVHPIAQGVVEDVLYNSFDYGHHVIIDHADGYKSLYGHLGNIFVKKGQSVDLTTVIGEVGLTGRTSGPHTHLEITRNGQYLNPASLLPIVFQLPTINSGFSVGGPLPKPKQESNLSKTLKPDFS
ncbi:MAG: M23 family metallopeptidase [Candidatus Daviesbacteria bacterium]|nr:M23 family metallopeptidase [Candidatus Daviesbacteria bacterium]